MLENFLTESCFFISNLTRTAYLLVVYFEIRSLDHKSCVVLPGLELLEQVDEGPEDEAVVLVHRAAAGHLLEREGG